MRLRTKDPLYHDTEVPSTTYEYDNGCNDDSLDDDDSMQPRRSSYTELWTTPATLMTFPALEQRLMS